MLALEFPIIIYYYEDVKLFVFTYFPSILSIAESIMSFEIFNHFICIHMWVPAHVYVYHGHV